MLLSFMQLGMQLVMPGLSAGESEQMVLRQLHRNMQHCSWLYDLGQRWIHGLPARVSPPGSMAPSVWPASRLEPSAMVIGSASGSVVEASPPPVAPDPDVPEDPLEPP